MTRGLLGILSLALTLGLLSLAAGTLIRAMGDRAARSPQDRPAQERVFAVNVERLRPQTAHPVVSAFGMVESWRKLELRASVGGTIVALSDGFRDGGQVAAGEVLIGLDPADADAALRLARNGQSEAEAELAEATAALSLARDDLAAAAAQRDLRSQALARQRDLRSRGAGTEAAVEAADLSLSAAEQTLLGRRQALAQAEARINRARIALERQRITVSEAQRALDEKVIRAPFAGLLSEVTAVRGGLAASNEKLGTLIDPHALEVSFRVSNAQFTRLVASGATLPDLPVTATLTLEDLPIAVSGRLDRVGATVEAGQTGRLLYARLDPAGTAALRPGDFMAVEVAEPPMDNVAVVPATAVDSAGTILTLDADDRLRDVPVTVLRRQGDRLILANAPFGQEYATQRPPRIGPGVKVRPVRPGDDFKESETIRLDPERRARLLAAVEANTRMRPEVRASMLEALRRDAVPVRFVDRIERRMGAGEPPGVASGDSLALDAARRARLIAFVERNAGLAPDAKARILSQLGADVVPREMVERLERRMGG